MTPTYFCLSTILFSSINSLLFDQNWAIITPKALKSLDKTFRTNLLLVTMAVKAQKQSVFQYQAYNIGVAIVKYKLEN